MVKLGVHLLTASINSQRSVHPDILYLHGRPDPLSRPSAGRCACQAGQVEVTLRYFDGCPNWQTADSRLRQVLDDTGHSDVIVSYEKVETPEDAERLGFIGSPTVLVDGSDPFATPGAPLGLACRVYLTPEGLAGSPTVEQLTEVLR